MDGKLGKLKFSIGTEIKVIKGQIVDGDIVYIITDEAGIIHHVPKGICIATFSESGEQQ
ncbi:MAG TPA: hypothetical protein VJJ82_01965 [Candidatus Nanoarchaeia archaeon]|nr:hypothetical protein [Candidatus Nanoarchaeia archaeon]